MTRVKLAALVLLATPLASAQSYGGFIDYVDCGQIAGWAWDSTQPNTPISVSIFSDNVLLSTVTAGNYRGDLQSAGIGNGYHGYWIAPPASIMDNRPHTISVSVAGANFPLPSSGPGVVLQCSAGATGYQYYYTDTLSSVNASNWTQNGDFTTGSSGLVAPDNTGGSLISTLAPPTANNYEVRATLNLTVSGGLYAIYVRGSSNAYGWGNGSYYGFEISNPTFSGSNCSASLNIWKVVAGLGATWLGATTIPCHNGMQIHGVVYGNQLKYYQDGEEYFWTEDNDLPSGQPGVGGRNMPSGNSIAEADLGVYDSTPPNPVNQASITTSSFPDHVDVHWQGVNDDRNGIGLEFYWVGRDGQGWLRINRPEFTDESITPGSTHSYTIIPQDWHGNQASGVSFTVTAPPSGNVDPRRTGVQPLGTYWGDMGEQIDVRSGNLNFSVPLLKAQGRGGWGVPFGLSYNSQQWRQDAAGPWGFGQDVGYGFGWQLMAGSITPYWRDYFSLDHYIFTDASGAEYRLYDPNNTGTWTSTQGVYVSYVAATQTLYFSDGSFWAMGSTSAGSEADAGAMYPTVMEDTNGNQVLITYATGVGVSWNNSSARIQTIEDVRATPIYNGNFFTGNYATYTFTYNNDAIPHLTGIVSNVYNIPGNYTFSYANGQNLSTPFSPSMFYGTTTYLTGLSNNLLSQQQSFSYTGSGELTQTTLPYGGSLRWTYWTANYVGTNGTRNQREVQYRYLKKSSSDAETTISFTNDGNWTTSNSVHPWVAVGDLSANASKEFWFILAGQFTGSLGSLTQTATAAQWWLMQPTRQQNFYWNADANGTPYVGTTETGMDLGTQAETWSVQQQQLDTHGNPQWVKMYGFAPHGQFGILLRTYTNTYVTDSNYTSRFIFNRLLTSTVTNGANTVTLVSNTYDNYSQASPWMLQDTPGAREHDSNYNIFFPYRGNLTGQTTPVKTVYYGWNIGGSNLTASDGNLLTSASPTQATNYAAPDSMTANNNSGMASSYTFNGALELTAAAMPNGANASAGYDLAGRVTSSTSPYGAQTTYVYNNNQTASTVTATTNGHWVRSTMDGLGRTIKVEKGDAGGTKSITESVYAPCACSPMGKVSQVSMPHAPNAGPAWTTYTYDALGRTTTIVKPDGSTTRYAYSGNTTTVTDAANNWKTFTTDALGNLVTVAEPDPNLGTVYTNYTYNLLNKLTQVSMPRGATTQTRTFTYDQSGQGARLMSATNPENGTVSYTYNGDGTLATKHDAKNQTVTYSYDGYQRMTQVSRSDGSVDNYTYDSYNGSQNAMGRLAATTFGGQPDPGSGAGTQFTYVYSYTPAGQVTAKTLTLARSNNSASLAAQYVYDGEGHMTSLTYPSTQQAVNVNGHPQLQTVPGPVFAYGYDSMGRANTLSQTAGDTSIYCPGCGAPSLPVGIVSGVDYGPASELLQIHGAGMNVGTPYPGETRTYNSLLQVTSIVTAGTSVQYGYPGGNNIGKINQKTDAITGEQVQYTYDSLGRLLTAQGSASSQGAAWNYTYSYDGFGNLTAKTGNGTAGWSAGADPTTNRAGGGSYDANGNYLGGLAQGPYTYDVENRLTAWQGASPGEQYGYDSSNKRIQKQRADGVEEIHFYGAGGERLGIYTVSAVYNGSQFLAYIFTPQTQNLYFAGKLVGRMNVGMNWVGQDRLGSDGGLHSYPWGEEKQTSSSNVEKFATYYRDQSTGLDYADQRYYSSIMGRFLTPDPYKAGSGTGDPATPQSWNRYAYVENDPLNYYDPRGQDTIHVLTYPCQVGVGDYAETVDCNTTVVNLLSLSFGTPEPPITLIVDPGIMKALHGLGQIKDGGFESKSKCRDFFNALAGGDGSSLMASVRAVAGEAYQNGTVYDGPSSTTALDSASFPGANSAGAKTVGDWFAQNPSAAGLSQFNGSAIWVNSSEWEASFFNSFVSNGSVNQYGLGTLMHELLHKQVVGGGFSHDQMDAALNAVGAGVAGYGHTGGLATSDRIGQICF